MVFCNSCGAKMQPSIPTCPECGSISGLIGGIRSTAVPQPPPSGHLMSGSAGHSPGVTNVADIHAIAAELEVDSDLLLFILVAADGSINRVGSGTFANKNRGMFIGKTNQAIFQRVRSHLTDSMLQMLGMGFRRQNPMPNICNIESVKCDRTRWKMAWLVLPINIPRFLFAKVPLPTLLIDPSAATNMNSKRSESTSSSAAMA